MEEKMTATKNLLEQERSLQELKNQKITELLKDRIKTQKDFEASKKEIAEELKALGYHTPRPRKSKVQTGAAK